MTIPEQIRPAYEIWAKFLEEQVDFWLETSDKHTKEHCKRVLLYCLMIADKKRLPIEARDILCTAAVFHDSRRQDDWLDVGHGQRAADYYKAFCAEHGLCFEQRCYDVMVYHDQDDREGVAAIRSRMPQEPDALLLYQIFKDADALDRFRLGPGGFDPKYLRTNEAKTFVEYAKKLLVCAVLTIHGELTLPIFLMMAIFSFVLFAQVEQVQNGAHTMELMETALDKLENIERAEFIDSDGKDLPIGSCDIDFENVCFGYDRRRVLDGISFHIPEGSTTAIVGSSGSGKTTICNLLARFYDVDSGCIRIGGRDIREMTCDRLLFHISMVFQNVYLFHDSILNNIRFGKQDATMDEIIAAAKKARCHDFIMQLPKGYDTVVGEGGGTLSGGEKQRISIARAILKDAPIIILDEATASVDPENEHLIQAAISELTRGKTMITIAHRLATIENADQILVVDGGKIAQCGTHAELSQQDGLYRRFVQVRQQAEGWSIMEA